MPSDHIRIVLDYQIEYEMDQIPMPELILDELGIIFSLTAYHFRLPIL